MNLDDLIISEDISVLEAMKCLNDTGCRIVFVAPQRQLQAVLTDSDVRKFILRGGDVSAPVKEAANYSPKSLLIANRSEARGFILKNSIEALPLLDEEGKIADVVFAGDLAGLSKRDKCDMPVVIMAGGLGSRLYPYTKILPKPLIPIGENPILEHIIHKFRDAGCQDFTLIVNYKRNMIKSYFADIEKEYDLHFVDEEIPMGTGGGLSLLEDSIQQPFFLTNCDMLIDADYAGIARFHAEKKNEITMVCAMKHFTIPYGVVETGEDGQLVAMREKPEMNMLTNVGMYIVNPSVLALIEKDKRQDFTDIIERCRQNGGRVGVYPISEAGWTDMGQIEELDNMRRKMEQST